MRCPCVPSGVAVLPRVSRTSAAGVVCGVQSYVFEPWSVVGVLVFGMRVRTSIAVCVAVEFLLEDV